MADRLTETFLDTYKQLEQLAQKRFGSRHESVIRVMQDSKEFSKYAQDLDYCREVRNLLTHNPKVGSDFAVTPSQSMIDLLNRLVGALGNPQTCLSIATQRDAMMCTTQDENVRAVMTEMRKRGFSFVPVLKGKSVVGVFDADALFGYLTEDGVAGIDDDLTVGQLGAHLGLDRKASQVFAFFARSTLVTQLEAEFEAQFKKGKRLAVAFITESGRQGEAVLGMVTAWDVLGKAQG